MDTGEIRVVTLGEFELFGSNGRHISADDMHSAVMTKFLLYLLTHRVLLHLDYLQLFEIAH